MENTAGNARLCRPDRQNALKETICAEERCVTTQKNGGVADYFGTTQSGIN